MSRGGRTRSRILDVALDAVLAKGFEATSIDEIVADAGITRSGFFYHFRDKSTLALAMIDRYADDTISHIDGVIAKVRGLTEDPLQVLLITLKILADEFADCPDGHPGCVVATAAFHDRLIGNEIRDANKRTVIAWQKQFEVLLEDVAEVYPANDDVDLGQLADFMSGAVAGGIIMARAHGDPMVTSHYLLLIRSHVKLLFQQRLQ